MMTAAHHTWVDESSHHYQMSATVVYFSNNVCSAEHDGSTANTVCPYEPPVWLSVMLV